MEPKTLEGEIIRDADKLEFISIARWKSRLENDDIVSLNYCADLLPKLRNELLHLDVSKKIFDRKIINFKTFIRSVKNPKFVRVKEKVLNV